MHVLKGPRPADYTLKQIARTLGVSLDAFTDPGLLAEMQARDELLRLWNALDSTEDRQAVLNVARRLADGRRG